MKIPACGSSDGYPKLSEAHKKSGGDWRRNQWPIRCYSCNRLLQPGEGIVTFSKDKNKYIGWC